MNVEKFQESKLFGKVKEAVKFAESLRQDKNHPVDITFAEVVEQKFQLSLESFFEEMGIDPSIDTISNITTLPELDARWIIPEIFLNALRLGYRKAPIWPNIVVAEEQIQQLSAVMPFVNMSDSAPRRVGEGETIPLGEISYGSKKFDIFKIGRGVKITDEVRRYASLNVVSIFLEDFGVKLGHAMDTLALDVLINGEQSDGSASAPVIGVASAGTKEYKDFLKIWLRMSRIGRMPNIIIGGEDAALDTLDMPEFKQKTWQYTLDAVNNVGAGAPGSPQVGLNLKTPIPQNADYYIHASVPSNQELMVDRSGSIIKYNAVPLQVESERIVSNQTEAFYASLTTGFAKVFRDASVIMDKSLAFASNGFPTYMDIDPLQIVNIE